MARAEIVAESWASARAWAAKQGFRPQKRDGATLGYVAGVDRGILLVAEHYDRLAAGAETNAAATVSPNGRPAWLIEQLQHQITARRIRALLEALADG